MPTRNPQGRLVCPACLNTGTVKVPSAVLPSAGIDPPTAPALSQANPARSRRSVWPLVAVVVVVLAVGGVAAWYFLAGSGAATTAKTATAAAAPEWKEVARVPYLLGGYEVADHAFDLPAGANMRYAVASADHANMTAAFLNATSYAVYKTGNSTVGQGEIDERPDPTNSTRVEAGPQHFILLCQHWAPCRGNYTIYVQGGGAPAMHAAPARSIESVLVNETFLYAATILQGTERFLVFDVPDQATVTYKTSERYAQPVRAYIIASGSVNNRSADRPYLVWSESAGTSISGSARLDPGVYLLIVICESTHQEC
ncbi:MAG: hypothetical protein LC620_07695, partial [Halobacteriales archaeon]|nr:hypothetical protein [Halobacteriales archaeon]